MIAFGLKKKQVEYPHHLMVPRQGNAMTEMPASLITSTWSLIIQSNPDNSNLQGK